MATAAKRHVAIGTAQVWFSGGRWHLEWEQPGMSVIGMEVRVTMLHVRGCLNARFAQKEAAEYLGVSEKSVLYLPEKS